MLCDGGIVVAADTRTVYADGSTAHMRKIKVASSADAAFVAAFASSDVPSTETLLTDIFSDLNSEARTSLPKCEEAVRAQMAKWDASHPHGAPDTEFIFAAALPNDHALYHCRPPNAMNRKAYIAIGQGAAIVDPIRNILFKEKRGPRTTLKEIAYLMYRAKNDYGSACGGETFAAFLRATPPAAIEVKYMSLAEKASVRIDEAMRRVLGAIFSDSKESQDSLTQAVDDGNYVYRKMIKFLTHSREEIADDGSIHPLPPPDFSLE